MIEEKVSIIVPAYNVEKYIEHTLRSIAEQTYHNWECIIVDDKSTDGTSGIIEKYAAQDPRFKLYTLEQNSGAGIARNMAIQKAQGRYLAFIDSDDVWDKNKLKIQLQFMVENEIVFSCTDYGKMDENGNIKNRIVKARERYDYRQILKECPGNSTVIYDCGKIGKIYTEDIRCRNDFVMWLKVIKVTRYAYGLNQVLTYHRERESSISINKTKLLKYQWYVYRKIEKLSFISSLYYLFYKIMQVLSVKIRYRLDIQD